MADCPNYAGVVVPAGASEHCHLGFLQQPFITGRIASGFKNHSRSALTRAVEVQSASTNIHRLSNSWRPVDSALLALPTCSYVKPTRRASSRVRNTHETLRTHFLMCRLLTRNGRRNDRITIRRPLRNALGYGRIVQLNKKLPNPIRSGTAPAIPPTTHFHSPDRRNHCRSREMAASYRSGVAPDASRIRRISKEVPVRTGRRKTGGCRQIEPTIQGAVHHALSGRILICSLASRTTLESRDFRSHVVRGQSA